MSRLPGAERAVVAEPKLRDYLLNPDHPKNGGKAALFRAFGYSAVNWTEFRRALVRHGQLRPVTSSSTTQYGQKHVVECSISTPDGRDPCLLTVWIVDTADDTPRLVTCYPSQQMASAGRTGE